MNKIINTFLLAGDKFMPAMHLRKPGFTYSACGPFTKNKEKIKNLNKREIQDKAYNELDKAYFQQDMTYEDFKDRPRRTASDKILQDKAFNIAKNPRYNGYQRGLASVVYKFFDKKMRVALLKMKSCKIKKYLKNYTNQLLENLKNKSTLTHYSPVLLIFTPKNIRKPIVFLIFQGV